MKEEEIRSILQVIIDKYPRPLFEKDFARSEEEEQHFRNKLQELKERDLIAAKIMPSRKRETVGLPLKVAGITITNKGRDFLENKINQPPEQIITTNINVTTHDKGQPSLNIAPGGTIAITDNADSEKLLKLLLSNIEASNLPEDQQEGLIDSVKSLFKTASPKIIADLLFTTVKALL